MIPENTLLLTNKPTAPMHERRRSYFSCSAYDFQAQFNVPAAARHLQAQGGPSYRCARMCCSRTICSISYSAKFSSFDTTLQVIFWIWSAIYTRTRKAVLSDMDAHQRSRTTPGSSWFSMKHSFLATSSMAISSQCHRRTSL